MSCGMCRHLTSRLESSHVIQNVSTLTSRLESSHVIQTMPTVYEARHSAMSFETIDIPRCPVMSVKVGSLDATK